MKTIPLQISFRNFSSSEVLEQSVKTRVQHLAKLSDRVTSCRVTIETPHRHHQKGKLFHVGVELTVPGDVLVTTRTHAKDHAHEDVYVAMRDAFDAAERQLRTWTERRREKSAPEMVG